MPLWNGFVRGRSIAALAAALLLCGCAGGGTSGDWYYHWQCNGDFECLTTNAGGTPSGTIDEGPEQRACTPLITFAQHFWGDAAIAACDQSPTWDGNSGHCGGGVPCGGVCTRTASDSANCGACGHSCAAAMAGSSCLSGTCQCGSGRTACPGAGGATTCAVTATDAANCGACGKQCQTGATCGGGKCVVTLVSIAVTPQSPTIFIGKTQQLAATGTYSDGSTSAIATPSWSATGGAASVSPAGLVTGVSAGTATVTATVYASGGQVQGNTMVAVVAATLQSLAVTPANPSIAKGLTQQFSATGTYSDQSTRTVTSQVVWSSDTTQVATIDSAGLATGVAAGTAGIIVRLDGISGNTSLTVAGPVLQSITVFPATTASDDRITQDLTRLLVATGHYSDGSTASLGNGATWVSASPGFVSVDGNGLATGVAPGSASITAAVGSIFGAVTMTTVAPGTAWTRLVSPTVAALYAVVWSGTQFVSVGAQGSIFTSPDGLQWTGHQFNTSNALFAIAWSGGKFVAVGSGGLVLTSPDGATWTARTSATSADLTGVAASSSLWVAVGNGVIQTSPDGATWTLETPAPTTAALQGICWSGMQFVTVATGRTLNSTDGTHWSPNANNLGASPVSAVAWSGTFFAAPDPTPPSGSFVLVSSDGSSWSYTQARDAGTSSLLGITWGGTQFAAVGTGGNILTSPTGYAWTGQSSGTTNNLRGVAWSGRRFVAVGDTGTTLVTSP